MAEKNCCWNVAAETASSDKQAAQRFADAGFPHGRRLGQVLTFGLFLSLARAAIGAALFTLSGTDALGRGHRSLRSFHGDPECSRTQTPRGTSVLQ